MASMNPMPVEDLSKTDMVSLISSSVDVLSFISLSSWMNLSFGSVPDAPTVCILARSSFESRLVPMEWKKAPSSASEITLLQSRSITVKMSANIFLSASVALADMTAARIAPIRRFWFRKLSGLKIALTSIASARLPQPRRFHTKLH